jgi:FMN phosphatase YigB (HAD superfamily)
MFVFLDIGFTLIGGPNTGPAGRLIQELKLPQTAKPAINELLFRTSLADPEDLADRITDKFRLDRSVALRCAKELWEKQCDEAYEIPGARNALERLDEAGISYGFISNIWAPFLQGFARLFPKEYKRCPVFASYQRAAFKPDPQLYLIALKETNTDPSQAIMIGDTYEMDIAPAIKLGIKTVWTLHRPEKEHADLVQVLNNTAPKPDLTLENITQLHPEQLNALIRPVAKEKIT